MSRSIRITFLATFLLFGTFAAVLAADAAADADKVPPEKKFKRGALIRFDQDIHPGSEQFLYRKLAKARQQGADLIVIEIDSPGGYLETSENIAVRLRDLDWAHTVAFIPDMALSGAAVMALGCDEIIMNPQGRIGDVGVIFLDEDFMFKYAEEKVKSDVVAFVRILAEAKGRSPALAEAMVDKDVVVYKVTNRHTNEISYMTQAEIDSLENQADWEKGPLVLESRAGSFLVVKGTRAVELKLANGYAETHDELRQMYGLERDFAVFQYGWVDTTVNVLNWPLVTGLLFVIGLIALYVEFSAPGIGIGGLTAALCFALFFWSRFLGGTADWLEVILFLCGLIFLAMELFVLPGFGVAGITGILLLFASLVMASQDFIVPSNSFQVSRLTTSLGVMLGSGVVFVIMAAVLSRHFGKLPVLGNLVLPPPTANAPARVGSDGAKTVLQSDDRFPVCVGDWGIADSPLRPAGKARFDNEYVDVVADGTYIDAGSQIRVIDLSGNRVMVRKVEEKKV